MRWRHSSDPAVSARRASRSAPRCSSPTASAAAHGSSIWRRYPRTRSSPARSRRSSGSAPGSVTTLSTCSCSISPTVSCWSCSTTASKW